MATVLKVREKGVLILPKKLRERAGIKEGSTVVATALDDGIILSPKNTNVLEKLLGLAKVSKGIQADSAKRIRSLRAQIDRERGRSNTREVRRR